MLKPPNSPLERQDVRPHTTDFVAEEIPMEHAASDWFLDETFWATVYPFMFPETSYAAAREQVGHLLAWTGLTGGTVLDLGCDPGRYAIPLAQRGFHVTGVDCTPFLLEEACAYATTTQVHVEWVQDDMRQFTRLQAFDLAVSLFTSFGYLSSSLRRPADCGR